MRTRRVCVTAQSKSSYLLHYSWSETQSTLLQKSSSVGRNLSLPYIPLSLPATLSQNTVCVFQNSQCEIALVPIWPLTIPFSEYPSAELSFSLKVGKYFWPNSKWPGQAQWPLPGFSLCVEFYDLYPDRGRTHRQTLSLTITAFKSYLVWHLDYSSLLTTHSDHQSHFWYFRMNLWRREQIF